MNEVKKILIVFGTRPEAIKMIPLVKELKKNGQLDVKVCVTGQHRQMLDQVLNLFEVVPNYDLNIMKPNQDLIDITSNILNGIKNVFKDFMPDLVLVHGDTTTCFATSIAAFYYKIKIGHVEAGLRTYNLNSPWPEEMNRQITDKITNIYFAPTEASKNNLIREGVSESKIFVTGNTVIDALLMVINKINKDKILLNQLTLQFEKLNISTDNKYILVTGHRRESFGEGFLNICLALKEIAIKYPEIDIIYPVHLNPNVKEVVFKELGGIANVKLIPPQDYLPFVYLMTSAFIILTDSGGVQEEGPSLNIPILVMRDTTERPEAVSAGVVKLIGTKKDDIVKNVSDLLDNKNTYNLMIGKENPYGDGKASQYISKSIAKYLCLGS
jgi:UDP-N-acetylglucosamine 2-epimerase (non-hydrolysing)